MICCCMCCGSLSHTCSCGNVLFSRNVAPGIAAFSTSNFSRKNHWWHATKFARSTRYVEWMGRGPNRKWEVVVEPDFFES